jgi:hypothetical protein
VTSFASTADSQTVIQRKIPMQEQEHTIGCPEMMRLTLISGLVVQAIASVAELGLEDLVSVRL